MKGIDVISAAIPAQQHIFHQINHKAIQNLYLCIFFELKGSKRIYSIAHIIVIVAYK